MPAEGAMIMCVKKKISFDAELDRTAELEEGQNGGYTLLRRLLQ